MGETLGTTHKPHKPHNNPTETEKEKIAAFIPQHWDTANKQWKRDTETKKLFTDETMATLVRSALAIPNVTAGNIQGARRKLGFYCPMDQKKGDDPTAPVVVVGITAAEMAETIDAMALKILDHVNSNIDHALKRLEDKVIALAKSDLDLAEDRIAALETCNADLRAKLVNLSRGYTALTNPARIENKSN